MNDIQLAHAKLNHLNSLVGDVQKEIQKCQEKIDAAKQKLEELHNESQ